MADWEAAEPVLVDEVARMDRLVDDMLLLARADEDVLAPRIVEVDLDDLVLAEVARLRAQTALQVSARSDPAKVLCDYHEVVRAVRNLADNAARFAKSQVRIATVVGAGTAGIEVADDGPGIPSEQRDRVLERFVRLDPDRSRRGGGSGLGLAIVAEIARVHGGSVVIGQSDLGGASVTLLLPSAGPTASSR